MMEDAERTGIFVEKMADFFRYNVKKGQEDATLGEELEAVDNYIYILNVRFAGDIHFSKEVDESLENVRMPSMILQPVVENVIKHAFRNLGRPGLAGISVRKKKDNLEITVYDNGCGIEKEELDKIQHNLEADAGQHEFGSIGIQNVNHRLKLLFGEEYGLRIASISDKGTAVKVVLPALYKEEMTEYVQTADNG